MGGEVAPQMRESTAAAVPHRGSRKAHQRSAQALPEKSSPSSAWASRRWRPSAMRKTAARQVSAPLKRALAAAQAPAGLLDVDGRGGADLAEQVLVGLVEGQGRALQDRLDRASGDAGSEQLTHELDRVTARDAVSDREGDDRCLQARAEGSPRHVGRQLGARRGATGRAAQALQAMLAEEHGGRRQLRDLMAHGLPARLALRWAEHMAAAATTRPVLDELVERLDRRQMTTVSRLARLTRPARAPTEQLAGAQARPVDPGWAAARSCASCASGAARARRCAPPAWRGARSARRPDA